MTSPAAAGSSPTGRAYWVLFLLVVVYALNFVDRNILSILIPSIQADLQISDTEMGLLTGLAFAILYTLAGFPIARLSDRISRRLVIALGMACWSLMTAASGLVRNYLEMLIARVGVGIGEASATPAAHSLISDYFPPQRRSTAIAIYNTGASLGIFLGMALGGFLNDRFGWRAAFVIVGLPGILMALVVRFAMPEPPRGQSEGLVDGGDLPSLDEVARHMLAQRSFRHLLAAAGLYSITAYAMIIWGATLLLRVHDLTPSQLGIWVGLAMGPTGALGAVLGGLTADRLGRRDARWLMWLPAIGCSLLVPCLAGFAFSPTPMLALLFLALASVLNQFYPSPSYAITQGLALLRMRAQASAMILFTINIVGMGLGPLLVGALSDALDPHFGVDAIRYSMAIVGLTNLWAALHSVLGARTLRADLKRATAS